MTMTVQSHRHPPRRHPPPPPRRRQNHPPPVRQHHPSRQATRTNRQKDTRNQST